jgi:hypothetical protein
MTPVVNFAISTAGVVELIPVTNNGIREFSTKFNTGLTGYSGPGQGTFTQGLGETDS